MQKDATLGFERCQPESDQQSRTLGVKVLQLLILGRGRKLVSVCLGQSFELVYLRTLQAERERNSRTLLEAANICGLKNEAERGRTALSLPPGATAPAWADLRARLPTEVKPGTCGAGRSGRARSSTKGQKLNECTAPGPGEPRTREKSLSIPALSIFL